MSGAASNILAIGKLYQESFVHASKMLYKGWLLIPLSVAAFGLFLAAAAIFGPMGIAGSFIVGLISVFLLSVYYSWLSKVHGRERLSLDNMREFDGALFMAVLNASFILFPLRLAVAHLRDAPDTVWVSYCFTLALIVLLNPIAEMIHVERSDGFSAVFRSYSFVLTNWIEWFLPLVVVMLPLILLGPEVAVVQLSDTSPLLPVQVIITSMRAFFFQYPTFGILAGIVVANWFMLFRAALFERLESGSRRQRSFKAQQ